MHYYFDDEVPQDQITTTFFAVENTCEAHAKLIGLQHGEPDWIQPNHTVEDENAARFAIVGDALDRNEHNALDPITNPQQKKEIETAVLRHNQRVIERYSNIFQLTNVKALSKGIWNSGNEENKRKNDALDEILANAPTNMYDIVEGGTARLLKKGIILTINWQGDPPDRMLELSVNVALTTNQKNSINAKLSARFGGKVVLV